MKKVLMILFTLLVVFSFATFADEGQSEDQLTIDGVEEVTEQEAKEVEGESQETGVPPAGDPDWEPEEEPKIVIDDVDLGVGGLGFNYDDETGDFVIDTPIVDISGHVNQ